MQDDNTEILEFLLSDHKHECSHNGNLKLSKIRCFRDSRNVSHHLPLKTRAISASKFDTGQDSANFLNGLDDLILGEVRPSLVMDMNDRKKQPKQKKNYPNRSKDACNTPVARNTANLGPILVSTNNSNSEYKAKDKPKPKPKPKLKSRRPSRKRKNRSSAKIIPLDSSSPNNLGTAEMLSSSKKQMR